MIDPEKFGVDLYPPRRDIIPVHRFLVNMPNLWIIFTTGLVAGGLTCMAVQGGLLTAALTRDEEEVQRGSRALGVAAFLGAKLVSHALLGFVLGWAGSMIGFTPRVQAVTIGLVSLFMIGTALSFLEIHPIFRYFVIQPPRFLTRYIRSQAKTGGVFAPAFIGFLSIFIPCGTTQAMMALAAGTGNPWWGMAVMAAFVAGTAPLFFLLGVSIDVIKATLKDRFGVVAATLVFVLALINFNAALTLYGSSVTLISLAKTGYCTITFCQVDVANQEPTQTPEISFWLSGYEIKNPVIPKGERVSLTLKNIAGSGCIQAFTIPALGLTEMVPVGETKELTFVAPQKPGELAFSCSMGMYGGTFIIK